MSEKHNVGDQSKQTILSSAAPSKKAKMNEEEFIDYLKGFDNPAPKKFIEFIRFITRSSNPASEEFIDYAEGVGLWILSEYERGTREDTVSYKGERFPVQRKGQNELLKDHAEILLDTVRRYRAAVSEKRWDDAVKCMEEAVEQTQHCLKLRESDVEETVLNTGAEVRAGLQKGRLARCGDPEERRIKVQQFLNEHREKYPRLGINAMILAAREACKVGRTYIYNQRRCGRLVIPDKHP